MSNNNYIDNSFKMLLHHFYRGSLNFFLNTNDLKIMNLEWQRLFLEATFHSELFKKYPLNNEFIKLFLKRIIKELEPYQDIHDDFYMELCNAMNYSASNGNEYTYRHYLICNEIKNIITIKEINKMVVNGTTGMRTWDASFMMANWALSNKEIFTNKKILELGSGVGFTGITIAKFCKIHTYLFTDCHHEVLDTICNNVEINFPKHIKGQRSNDTYFEDKDYMLGVLMLNWNNIEDLNTDIIPDILMGADIVYDPSIIKPLINVIELFCKRNKHLEVFIACVIRNEVTFKLFLEDLETKMLSLVKIEVTENAFIEWDNNIPTCILRIKSI